MQASDKALSANDRKMMFGSATVTESDASSTLPLPPPPISTALVSKINDRILRRRMLSLVLNNSSKPLQVLAVNTYGTELAPLRHFNFAEVEYLDLGSLVTSRPHDGVFSNVILI